MAWLFAVGIGCLFYGLLGVDAGRRNKYLSGSYREAMNSSPAPQYRYGRAQDWFSYRYRKQILAVGLVSLLAGIVDVILRA
jgi:hypothetical protein